MMGGVTMRIKGYCSVQDKETVIIIDEIPAPTLDNPNNVVYGRIYCDYASNGGKCDCHPCSIIKKNQ